MKYDVVIVDAMILAYRVCNSPQFRFTNSKGEPTGLRFGFMRSLLSYAKKFAPAKIVVAWDMPGPVLKAEGHESYKANRHHAELEKLMFSQLESLQDLIKLTKFDQLGQEGYEADDLIAAYEERVLGNVLIISADGDLNQLVCNRVHQWSGKSTDVIMNQRDVWLKWNVQPDQLALFRSISGDSSDNLKPILNPKEARTKDLLKFISQNAEVTCARRLRELCVIELTEQEWTDLEAREKLMKPLYPEKLYISRGTSHAVELKKELDAMESKTLLAAFDQML